MPAVERFTQDGVRCDDRQTAGQEGEAVAPCLRHERLMEVV